MSHTAHTFPLECPNSMEGVKPFHFRLRWLLVIGVVGSLCSWCGAAEDKSGWKIDGRFGHIALQALGRDTGITPLELFPHLISEDQILFGDFRTFVTNDGRLGGNFGAGWRFIEPTDNDMLGVSAWYDIDNSTGNTFHQLGLNLEARMAWAGIESNLYLPVGDRNQILDRRLSNIRFDDHNILFDVASQSGESMPGIDATVSAYLPFDYLIDHQVQASCGWYHFRGDQRDDINGFKLQVDGNIVETVSAQVALTHDKTFGTNTTVGLSWRFGSQGIPEADLNSQLKRFTDRNYNIIVSQQKESQLDVAAVNQATNANYTVQHVGSGIGGDVGTSGDPWQRISEAQLAGGDVLFVHANATLTESVVLQDGQYLFGEGVTHQLVDSRYGAFTLPTATSETTLPRLLNTPGTAITLADNTHVSGIRIEQAGGDAISGIGVDNVKINNVSIHGARGHGLLLDTVSNAEVSGNIVIQDVNGDGVRIVNFDDEIEFGDMTISDVGGSGIHIIGGHGEMAFTGQTVIENSSGSAFRVINLESILYDDTVDEDGDDDDGNEEDLIGTVTVEDLQIVGADGGQGITILDSDGLVTFALLDVQTTNGSALEFHNAEEVWIADGTLKSTGAPVADIEDSSISIALESIYANGGQAGLRITNSEGDFFVYGDGAADDEDDIEGTGGLIQNTDVAIDLVGAGSTGMQYVNFLSNGIVAQATDIDSLAITLAKITETSQSFVDATNLSSLQISASHFEDNAMSSGYGVRFRVNTTGSFVSTITNNIVSDTQGTFYEASTLSGGETSKLSSTFESNEITLSTSGDVASQIDWSGTVQASMSSNLITGDATSQTAFELNLDDSSNLAEIAVHSNTFVFHEANAVAVRLTSQSPATLSLQQNQIAFNERDGVGFDLTIGKTSGVTVSGNSFYDYAGGASAIRFRAGASKLGGM